jgi:biotin carboxylase
MEPARISTVLCLASYEKGGALLDELKKLDRHVVLLTTSELENAAWPREVIDEFFVMPELAAGDDLIHAVSYLARTRDIERIIPLDDYDVLTAAFLREHLRLPGIGVSRARLVRDKLAMRVAAHTAGVLAPEFVHILNYERIAQFTRTVPPPWVLKPRMEVSAIGISRVERDADLWPHIEALGDRQSHFLLERYVPGDVYHVDSVVHGGQVLFAEAHGYARPPMDVFHGGGIAMTRTLERGSEDAQLLQSLNRDILGALHMDTGIAHLELIKGHTDGRFYFLEVGARVGGAHTAEMVEAATGINLWREWARLEIAGDRYRLPEFADRYGGVILSLARQEHPDTSGYTDPEIVYRVTKRHHVGFVLCADAPERVRELQEQYSRRIADDFAAVMPAWQERPPNA